MADQFEPTNSSRPSRAQRRRMGWTIRITPMGVIILLLINLAILGGWAYVINRFVTQTNQTEQGVTIPPSDIPHDTLTKVPPTEVTSTSQPTASPTASSTDTSTPIPISPSPQPIATLTLNQGLIILALDEGGNTHLFAYHPEEAGLGAAIPLTRLTDGPWDDITPAISPDGQTVAFSSNRNGYWDIYLLDLNSSGITRLTDTLEYEASPAWSPDNKWLVYEAYVKDNIEIRIQSILPEEGIIRLTDNAAADFSPAWSPDGRRIVFVSNRSGEDEIWLADLDKSEDLRFQNISQDPASDNTHPTWSPDGKSLVWVGEQDGMHQLWLADISSSNESSQLPALKYQRSLGSGDWPVWSADGEVILTGLQAPNQVYLTAYRAQYPGLVLPAVELPGQLQGLSWGIVSTTAPLQVIYQQAVQLTPTPLYQPVLTSQPTINGERYQLSPLEGVKAPHPYLHDLTDESFSALRTRLSTEAGWDFLATLENAYVPLTSPLDPGMGNDWLYTGRAFALDKLPLDSGWMVVVREDFGSQTFWRIYIKPLFQDGSAGIPLHDQPWDFYSRNNGDTTTYELGGFEQESIPPGYWIDFTARAHSYAWERMPALVTWRASYPAARFNEFVLSGGLDWETAMLELYPPESMITPSPVVPPTRTPTPTSRWYTSPTPTATVTPRPTFTPGFTMSATPIVSPESFPAPSPTPGG